MYYPDTASAQKMVRKHGTNLFYTSPELRKLCCQIRKIEPLKRALKGLDAWISGLRRTQNVSRADIPKVEVAHFKIGNVKREIVLPLIVSGSIGGIIGAYGIIFTPVIPLKILVGIILLMLGVLSSIDSHSKVSTSRWKKNLQRCFLH